MKSSVSVCMKMINYISILLLFSLTAVYPIRRERFIPPEGGFKHNNHSLEFTLENYYCNSCPRLTIEDEETLNGQTPGHEFDPTLNTICHGISSSSQETKMCMQMGQRYLYEASFCLKSLLLGEIHCRNIEFKQEIPRALLSSSTQNTSLSENAIADNISQEALKGFLRFSLKHKEYKSCAPCRSLMEDIQNAVGNTQKQIAIIKILHEVCNVADTYATQCKKMILMYGPLLLGNVQKMVTVNDLCYMANMCKDPLPPPPPPPSPPQEKGYIYNYI